MRTVALSLEASLNRIVSRMNLWDHRTMRLVLLGNSRLTHVGMMHIAALLLALSSPGCASSTAKGATDGRSTQSVANPGQPVFRSERFGPMYGRLIFMTAPNRTQLGLQDHPSFIGLLTTLDENGTFRSGYTLRVGNVEWTNVELPSGTMLSTGSPISTLAGKAHLVRVTVAERESGAYVRLRARDVVRLDGTPEAPFDVESILVDFLDNHSAVTPRHKNLTEQLVHALEPLGFDSTVNGNGPRPMPEARVIIHDAKDPPKPKAPPDPGRKTSTLRDHQYWATWIPATQSLHMVIWLSLSETWQRLVPNPRAGVFGCEAPPGADCAPTVQPPEILKIRKFQAEVAVVGTYSQTTRRTVIEEVPVEVHERF